MSKRIIQENIVLKVERVNVLQDKLKKDIVIMTGIQNIPTQYQYFSDKTKGGYLQADYCPIKLEGNSRIESYFAENCRVGKNDTFPTSLEEKIGNNSICVESSLTRKDDPFSSQYKGK